MRSLYVFVAVVVVVVAGPDVMFVLKPPPKPSKHPGLASRTHKNTIRERKTRETINSTPC